MGYDTNDNDNTINSFLARQNAHRNDLGIKIGKIVSPRGNDQDIMPMNYLHTFNKSSFIIRNARAFQVDQQITILISQCHETERMII